MDYTLSNEWITVKVRGKGAELRSLTDNGTGREFMWQADPEFWGRTSPVLFPVVGSYRNGESRYNGEVYKLSQHGFARDMEFMLTRQTEDEIWFCLTDKTDTWNYYPFAFSLEIGYRLEGRSLRLLWKVSNPAQQDMYFSIGGHPAFNVEPRSSEKTTCYVRFEGTEQLTVRGLEKGLALADTYRLELEQDGLLAVTEEVFAGDALIVENHQAQKVSLLDENKETFLTVDFDAPLFGVWTPPGKNAPFVCIEPWYGRCDRVDFEGTIEQREWGNHLTPGEVFEASYTVTV